jgi:uncharacterized protein (DUF433 family)
MAIENLDRITQDPAVMGGKPCIRGMRVTVGMIVGQIGAGVSIEEILSDYPYLECEDVMQALRYAAALSQWREVALAEA